MSKVTDLALALASPIAAEHGCSIWDIEYLKEAGAWFLRVYLDKPEGVGVDDCENVSRALSDALDEADPIEGSYVLEVSSPGADRTLKTPEQFAQFLGETIEVRLYRPLEGKKALVGALSSYDGGDVTLQMPEAPLTVPKKDIAQVKLYLTF